MTIGEAALDTLSLDKLCILLRPGSRVGSLSQCEAAPTERFFARWRHGTAPFALRRSILDEKMSTRDDPARGGLTYLLNRMQSGDKDAGDQAVTLVYDELHRIAARQMQGERGGGDLQTTALIHEAYARLVGGEPIEIQSRGHFFAIASQQMRRVLVDAARSERAQKRGGLALKVPLDEVRIAAGSRGEDMLALDEALRELELIDPRAAKVVELRYFGGYTDKEVVETLGVALSTVRRDWEFARSWLFDQMNGGRTKP